MRRHRSKERERTAAHTEPDRSRRRGEDRDRDRGEDRRPRRDSDARASRDLHEHSPTRQTQDSRPHSERHRDRPRDGERADMRRDRDSHDRDRREPREQRRSERHASSGGGHPGRGAEVVEPQERSGHRSGRAEESARSRTAARGSDGGRRSTPASRPDREDQRAHSAPRNSSRPEHDRRRGRSSSRERERASRGLARSAGATEGRHDRDYWRLSNRTEGERVSRVDDSGRDVGSGHGRWGSGGPRSASRDSAIRDWIDRGRNNDVERGESRGRFNSERGRKRADSAPDLARSSQDDVQRRGRISPDGAERMSAERTKERSKGHAEGLRGSRLSRWVYQSISQPLTLIVASTRLGDNKFAW